MASSASELAQLRITLQELKSYEFLANCRLEKENYPNSNDGGDGGISHGAGNSGVGNPASPHMVYDPQLLQRYKTARNSYIQQATIQKFLSSLAQYDAATNTLPLPDTTEDEQESEREALRQRREEILDSVKGTLVEVSSGVEGIRTKWEQFCDKREELTQIVEGMERNERKRRLEDSDGSADENDVLSDEQEGGEGEEITEEDVANQEEKLDELQQRKLELENRLRRVRAQILDVEDNCHRTKRAVNEVRVKGGRDPLDWRGLNNNGSSENGLCEGTDKNLEGSGNENVEYISVVAQGVEAEIAKMEEKSAEFKKSAEFYDGIRELMEELGGVKIVSSKSISSSASSTINREGTGRDGENSQKKQKHEEEGFVLTLMLLGSHILEITLTKSPRDKDGLHVSNAKLTTETTFPMHDAPNTANDNEETTSLIETIHSISLSHQSFSIIMSQKPSVEVTIPPLDDLVTWSQSFENSSHGIKFVIVETLARIRTLEARVAELATLREKYAAQVYDVETSLETGKYGVAEQEVVCAIPEGITTALRLGADCPLVPGSVYVSEIFGVGGWQEEKLEELRKLVTEKRCRGPVEVMECMVKEIRERSDEEGWAVPDTPSLPRCKN